MKGKVTIGISLLTMAIFVLIAIGCKKEGEKVLPTTVTDIEGNTYHTIKIGSQLWMVENLRTTRFNDGTDIPIVTDSTAWTSLTSPGSTTYNNTANPDTIKTYGRLYNGYAVNTGKLCPNGWRVPTESDWSTLIDHVGGKDVAGIKLKEAGTAHWSDTNIADNTSGFTALPGGNRGANAKFFNMGKNAYYWSQTIGFYINSGGTAIDNIPFNKNFGLSVCCIKE